MAASRVKDDPEVKGRNVEREISSGVSNRGVFIAFEKDENLFA